MRHGKPTAPSLTPGDITADPVLPCEARALVMRCLHCKASSQEVFIYLPFIYTGESTATSFSRVTCSKLLSVSCAFLNMNWTLIPHSRKLWFKKHHHGGSLASDQLACGTPPALQWLDRKPYPYLFSIPISVPDPFTRYD